MSCTEEPRSYLCQVLRLTAEFLGERKLLAQVVAKVSPEAQRALQKPPFLFSWIPAAVLDEIFDALFALPKGSETCAELGHFAARNLSGSLIAPVLQMALGLFGATPASVFANLDRFFAIATRGTGFEYEPFSSTEGVVRYRVTGDAPDAMLHVTRGNLRQVFELCQTPGEVDPPERLSRGEARFRVRWG